MAKNNNETEAHDGSAFLHEWYPDPKALLEFEQLPLAEALKDCFFVLDANALLVPYLSSSGSFAKISETFALLAGQKRLFVPMQALREFFKHRSRKLGDIYKQLIDFGARDDPRFPNVRFLEGEPEYEKIQDIVDVSRTQLNEARRVARKIADEMKTAVGSDPVTRKYRELFSESILEETEADRVRTMENLRTRYAQRRPPGFQDEGKPDGGIGDLLIWDSLLRCAAAEKRHCVFVSGEQKNDWWTLSAGTFQPRLELLEEYRAASQGKSLHLISLAQLMENFGASETTVEEIQEVQDIAVEEHDEEIPIRFVVVRLGKPTDLPSVLSRVSAAFPSHKIYTGNGEFGLRVGDAEAEATRRHLESVLERAGVNCAIGFKLPTDPDTSLFD